MNPDTCGRGNFCIRKEKVADSKISGHVWTGPEYGKTQARFFSAFGSEIEEQIELAKDKFALTGSFEKGNSDARV